MDQQTLITIIIACAFVVALVVFFVISHFKNKKNKVEEVKDSDNLVEQNKYTKKLARQERAKKRREQELNKIEEVKEVKEEPVVKYDEEIISLDSIVKEEVKEEPTLVEEKVVEVVEEVKDDDNEEVEEKVVIYDEKTNKKFQIRYNKSLEAKLILGDRTLKGYYSDVKNCLMSYDVKNRLSWKHETFKSGRKTLAILQVRGKTLCLYLALDPKKFEGTKYLVEDVSSKKEDTPSLFRIKSDRKVEYAKDLIRDVMKEYGLEEKEITNLDYAKDFKVDTLEHLIERGLVKENKVEVSLDTPVSEHPNIDVAPFGYRYRKSFTAKIIQAEVSTKFYYSEIKKALLSYEKISSRISWGHESFKRGRVPLALLEVRGKTLCLYLNMDPKLQDSKYHVEDVSSKKEDTPTLIRVKTDRKLKYSLELINKLMTELKVELGEVIDYNYVLDYPFEENEPLIERGLIKVYEVKNPKTVEEKKVVREEKIKVVKKVEASEANKLVSDNTAERKLRYVDVKQNTSKKAIINIDVLAKYFENGEVVDLKTIKERIPGYKKTTYIKVLGRGMLDKKLKVIADDYSPLAVKMILLLGGDPYITTK